MPKLPILKGGSTIRQMIDTFLGYNHNLKIKDGELFWTKDLTVSYYPMLANRQRRGILNPSTPAYSADSTYTAGTFCTHDGKLYRCKQDIGTAEAWTAAHWEEASSRFEYLQGIIAKDKLYYVAKGYLYTTESPVPLMSGLDASGYQPQPIIQQWTEKTLVSFGAYIIIYPDKKYFNTADSTDYGSLDAFWSQELGDGVTAGVYVCDTEGNSYSGLTVGEDAPASPSDEDYWLDTTVMVIKQWSATSNTWWPISDACTRLYFLTVGNVFSDKFSAGDWINISGFTDRTEKLNGYHELVKVGTDNGVDYLVLKGVLGDFVVGLIGQSTGGVAISRRSPDVQFVCECQNRLWGCYYGLKNGEMLNEVYASALGDFKNWHKYEGVSTDSWAASVGSDGDWTGAINYLGKPTFFKENRIHQVTVSAIGAHRLDELVCRGIQPGSAKSAAIVNETLYYKSRAGVMAWQGGMPADVSSALGDEAYHNARAGVYGQRYYISMQDSADKWNLFCYDAGKGLWMREDALQVVQFAQLGEELYAMVKTGSGSDIANAIYALNGTVGDAEDAPRWIAETGIQHYEFPDKKYVSRYDIRLKMDAGARLQMYIEYDSKAPWVFVGDVRAGDISTDNTGSCLVPVRPRRCDHLRLRLEGEGNVKILSITRILQQGSDI